MWDPRMNDILKLSGCDKYNEQLDKQKQQAIDEHHHKENLNEQRIANEISKQALEEARDANRRSKRANIITIVSVCLSSVISLISLAIAIWAKLS